MKTGALKLDELQPTQLYISRDKLAAVQASAHAGSPDFAPIPVKRLGGRVVCTDGHTRAVAAHLAGLRQPMPRITRPAPTGGVFPAPG